MAGSELKRRFTDAIADTREGEPPGRTYAVPFAEVWDALLRDVGARRGWTLVHADEEMGLLTALCRSLRPHRPDDLSVWVALDENGLTRVEVRSAPRAPGGDLGVNRRRVLSLLARLDGAVRPGVRVETGPSRPGADG
ncbi:MAG: DUF1499 domain-containing protein [Gemmatimonadota bacterium]